MPAQLSEPASRPPETSYQAPTCIAEGTVRSSKFQPDGYSLWRGGGELEAGTCLLWSDDHGDEGVFVVEGELEVDDQRAPARSAVLVEAGVPVVARAVERTTIVHFGPADPDQPIDGPLGGPDAGKRGVHVVEHEQASMLVYTEEQPVAAYFSDGSCPTCRIAFFEVDKASGFVSTSHIHSEDEIIHVLDGVLQVGPLRVEAGMSIAVPKGVRYGFRTDGPFRFLNYRRDVSRYTGVPGSEQVLETIPVMRGVPQATD
jgi:hypothetical protein